MDRILVHITKADKVSSIIVYKHKDETYSLPESLIKKYGLFEIDNNFEYIEDIGTILGGEAFIDGKHC